MHSRDEDEEMNDVSISSPVARRQGVAPLPARVREATIDSVASRDDSPSRQLNGHFDIDEAASELEKLPTFEGSHEDAVAAFKRSAEELLRLMNEAKLRKKFNCSTRRIYDELEATLADEVAEETMKTPGKPGNRAKTRHRLKSVLRSSGAGKAHKRARGIVEEVGNRLSRRRWICEKARCQGFED